MKIVDQVPEYIRSLIPYEPGKPIEEVEREYGISDSVKLASNENPLGPVAQGVGRDRATRWLSCISIRMEIVFT